MECLYFSEGLWNVFTLQVCLVVFPTKNTALLSSLFLVLANTSNPNKKSKRHWREKLTIQKRPIQSPPRRSLFPRGKPSQWLSRWPLGAWRQIYGTPWRDQHFTPKIMARMADGTLDNQKKGSFRCYVLGCPPLPKWQMKVYLLESWAGVRVQPKLCEL